MLSRYNVVRLQKSTSLGLSIESRFVMIWKVSVVVVAVKAWIINNCGKDQAAQISNFWKCFSKLITTSFDTIIMPHQQPMLQDAVDMGLKVACLGKFC